MFSMFLLYKKAKRANTKEKEKRRAYEKDES